MKKTLFFFGLILSALFGNAQTQGLNWAKKIGGYSNDEGHSIAVDRLGNVYTIGLFQGTVDFDPGDGVYDLTASSDWEYSDVFISKLDALGNFVWAKKIADSCQNHGYNIQYSIAIDISNNIYYTGAFQGTVDFDPGTGVFNLTADSLNDIFISKLDAFGSFIWAKSMGASRNDFINAISVDSYGNVLSIGVFTKTVDFDPGEGIFNLISSEYNSTFILKLDSLGNFIWAKKIGATNSSIEGLSISIDAKGNIYYTGIYGGTVDFDPGAEIFNLVSTIAWDIFISKLDSGGNFLWAKSMGGSDNNNVEGLTIDAIGNVYITGDFSEKCDFDPSEKEFIISPIGGFDIFIAKLDAKGNFLWAKNMGGNHIALPGRSIASDMAGNVYITGRFSKTCDFDPGTETFNLTTIGGVDIFILKLNTYGNLVWVKKMGGVSQDEGVFLVIDALDNIYVTGHFNETADFGMGAGTFNLYSAGRTDVFILKMHQDSCTNMALVIDSVADLSCAYPTGFASVHALHGMAPYKYLWNTIPSFNDSFVHFNIKGNHSIIVTDSNKCIRTTTVVIDGPTDFSGFDLNANLITNRFRPGRQSVLRMEGLNERCTPVTGKLSIVLDSLVKYNNASPTPDMISGDTLIWNFSNLDYDSKPLKPQVSVTPDTKATIGDTICFDVIITPVSGDAETKNNIKRYCYPVVNSYDPNIKSVYPAGACKENYVLKDELLAYTLQFQNTGNAEAIDIFILDTLDADLDINTLRVAGQSHQPMITEVLPGNILKFRFDGINLPDSHANEKNSHGYVIYKIKPKTGLLNGTSVGSKAGIYFDFNPAVMTNDVRNTLVTTIPACSVGILEDPFSGKAIKIYPNPTSGHFTLDLDRSGQVLLYDLVGNLCFKTDCQSGKNDLDVSTLANGIYFLKSNGLCVRIVKID